MRPLIPTLAFTFLATTFPLRATADAATDSPAPALMPMPAKIQLAPKRWALDSPAPMAINGSFKVGIFGAAARDERVRAAVTRLLQRWGARTGLTFDSLAPDGMLLTVAGVDTQSPPGSPVLFAPTGTTAPLSSTNGTTTSIQTLELLPLLVITSATAAPALPALGEDESYTLDIAATYAQLDAPTTTGVLRGIATLTQLLQQTANGYSLPNCFIQDSPRFPWRGLMIDCSRHWMPIEVIKRQLDGMELVKLNVLHLHLSDDQGFRIESKTHPELQQKGSDGHYFTQEQIREIIRYAAARAIRVVPEFDMPGHVSSWSPSHPELMSGSPRNAGDPPSEDSPGAIWDGTYRIERTAGIFDMVFNPANEATYAFLSEFLGEMAALFPDPYFHIGGDENNGAQWSANPAIQKFIADNHLKNNAGLQTYFTNRVGKILAAHDKKPVGWEEILNDGLAPGSVIDAWRGNGRALAAAAKAGYPVILSAGYYLDLNLHASDMYLTDPLPANTPLTPDEQKLILGGEAPMWAEWVNAETIDSRIWPRAAAVAERLWSPQTQRDVDDMYRRLAAISLRLDEAGLQHIRNRESLLMRLAGDNATPDQLYALRTFSAALEPVKRYQRSRLQREKTQQTPLVGLVDAVVTDSASARQFNADVAAFLEERKIVEAHKTPPKKAAQILNKIDIQIQYWQDASEAIATQLATSSPQLKAVAEYADRASRACKQAEIALTILSYIPDEQPHHSHCLEDFPPHSLDLEAFDQAMKPNELAVEFPAAAGMRQLIIAALEQSKQNTVH